MYPFFDDGVAKAPKKGYGNPISRIAARISLSDPEFVFGMALYDMFWKALTALAVPVMAKATLPSKRGQ
ncbi:MAG: hypothetical protein R6W72_12220 [Desulfurivibrionaceae bacterium]